MKNIIAKSTQITTQFASAFGVSTADVSKIKEYRNKNIAYDGKIYQTYQINDIDKQLNKDFYNKSKSRLDKISDQQLYKQFLLKQNAKQLKDLIQIITISVVNDSDLLKNSIGAKASSKYVFIPRGKQENQDETQDDKKQLSIDFIKDKEEQIEQTKKQFLNNSKNLYKTFKTNFANSDKKTIQKQADKASNDLETNFNTLLTKYDSILTEIETEYSKTNDQKLKQFKQLFEKRIQKIENQKDNKIDEFIQKCKKLKSKYQKMNIDGSDRKIEVIKQFTDGYIGKFAGSDEYALISKRGELMLQIPSLDDEHYRIYDDYKCIRILKDGIKDLFPFNDFTAHIDNAFVIDTDGINDDFSKDYFVISNNGKYQVRKISEGITGSVVESKNNFAQLKQYIQNYGGSSTSSATTTTSSTSSATTSSFNISDYESSSNKKDYLQNLSQNEIIIPRKLKNKEKGNEIITNLSGTGKSFKFAKQIKVSRYNRHLSLQELALNSIFKKLGK